MDKPNYYAVIPSTVRYDSRLTGDEKVLYGEITALTQKEGYCWANNEYFATLYEVHKITVSGWVNNLKDCGHIETEVDKLGNRKIYIAKPLTQTLRGISPNTKPPLNPNAYHNNTSINTKSNIASDDAKRVSFEDWVNTLEDTTSDYEGDGEVSELVYRRDGRAISEKALRREYLKLHPAPRETPVKSPRTHENFNFDSWLIHLRNSSNKVNKIVALIWKEKGYRFENYEQWKAQMDVDGVYAKKLLGYSGPQIAAAIERCRRESKEKGYDWKASTVVKKIAEITI